MRLRYYLHVTQFCSNNVPKFLSNAKIVWYSRFDHLSGCYPRFSCSNRCHTCALLTGQSVTYRTEEALRTEWPQKLSATVMFFHVFFQPIYVIALCLYSNWILLLKIPLRSALYHHICVLTVGAQNCHVIEGVLGLGIWNCRSSDR